MVLATNVGWIGVDLGTHTVKLAQVLRSPSGARLHRAAVIQRSNSWSAADGLAVDEPDPSWTEIAAALECGNFRGRNATCLLPMNVCELRGLKIPPGDEQQRRAMIESELADDDVDRPVDREFDFWDLGGEKDAELADGFNVNVISVRRAWLDQIAGDCQRVDLDCWAVDGTPLAIARAVALASPPQKSERVLALDWGFSNTTLCLVGKGRPLYARRLHDCHLRQCLAAIQDSLGVTLDYAQHLVDVHGVALPNSQQLPGERPEIQAAVTDAVTDPIESLVEQIERTLHYIEVQRRQQRPSKLWLMGGGGALRNIAAYLSAKLGLEVSLWRLPADDERGGPELGRAAPLFAGAVALSTLAWRDT